MSQFEYRISTACFNIIIWQKERKGGHLVTQILSSYVFEIKLINIYVKMSIDKNIRQIL